MRLTLRVSLVLVARLPAALCWWDHFLEYTAAELASYELAYGFESAPGSTTCSCRIGMLLQRRLSRSRETESTVCTLKRETKTTPTYQPGPMLVGFTGLLRVDWFTGSTGRRCTRWRENDAKNEYALQQPARWQQP